jgi:hypothetical protein
MQQFTTFAEALAAVRTVADSDIPGLAAGRDSAFTAPTSRDRAVAGALR